MITMDDLKAVELALVEKGQASKRYKLDEIWELNLDEIKEALATVPSVQPESTKTFVELVMEYPDPELCTYKEYKGKPYYAIKYIENGEMHVGYGTYNPEVLSQYLKEYFISSAQSEKTEFIPDVKAVRSKRDCVDLSERVLATFYDQEHEEWTQQTVTIADVLDSVCDEYTILPAVQPEQRWIPITEKLPEEDGIYIISGVWGNGKKQVGECEFCVYNGHFKVSWNFDVKAWMPLPEPYKEEKK